MGGGPLRQVELAPRPKTLITPALFSRPLPPPHREKRETARPPQPGFPSPDGGWAEYFSFGFTGQADQAIAWHVKERVRRFLCRRHKLRVNGTNRFGYTEVHGKMGVLDIHQRRLRLRLRLLSREEAHPP
ncbi:MAG: group II intron maturase-specific domain-containing protein [Thermoanaerobaculia bacterium]